MTQELSSVQSSADFYSFNKDEITEFLKGKVKSQWNK